MESRTILCSFWVKRVSWSRSSERCTVRCDEVHHLSWNISPQDAWHTGPCSSNFPRFRSAWHSDNYQQSPREWYTLSVISCFLCLRCDEVHHPAWNISPQDAWYIAPCSSNIPRFRPAWHSDKFQQSLKEWYTLSIFFFLLSEIMSLALCVLRLSTLHQQLN